MRRRVRAARRDGHDRVAEADARGGRSPGARALVIGVAKPAAIIPKLVPALVEALEAGLDIVAACMRGSPTSRAAQAAAERLGRRLIDVRDPPPTSPSAPAQSAAASGC